MSISIAHAEFLAWPEIQRIFMVFGAASVDARFVGGCVRNALLGLPVKDVDLCTPAHPEKVMEMLAEAGIHVIPTGMEHGTVTAHIGAKNIEITTLRSDIACDGRHAEVAYTSDYAEDAKRRDFTINAMSADAQGKVYDYHHGMDDLRAGKLRFIGDAETRITEDALRILRLFRFESELGFAIDVQAFAASALLKEKLRRISAERIRAELFKLLAGKHVEQALQHLAESGIWELLFAESVSHGIAPLLAPDTVDLITSPLARFAWLISLTHPPEVKSTCAALQEKLRLSNDETRRLTTWLTHLPAISATLSLAEQRRMQRRVGTDDFLVLLGLASARDQQAPAYRTMTQAAKEWTVPVFPLRGADLLAIGVAQGSQLGALLNTLEEHWEASGYTLTKETLLEKAAHVIATQK